MKLICAHCDRHDAAPLAAIPRDWLDISPDRASGAPTTSTRFTTAAGTIADTFGICPSCEAHRKTAFIPVPPAPYPVDLPAPPAEEAANPQGLLF